MKKWMVVLLILVSLSGLAEAPSVVVKGYLLDGACYDRLKPKANLTIAAGLHSRDCLRAPFCERSGYGVLTDDKRFIKFDQASNERVKKFIATFNKETDIKVTVTGTVDGDKMTLSKIELQ